MNESLKVEGKSESTEAEETMEEGRGGMKQALRE